MLGAHCIRLAFQMCLPLAFLASVVAAFKTGARSLTNYIYNEQMDQSALNVQLFTFQAAEASVHGRDTVHDSSEPHGSCIVQYHLPILDP